MSHRCPICQFCFPTKTLLEQCQGSRKCNEARQLFLEKEKSLEGEGLGDLTLRTETMIKNERLDSDSEIPPTQNDLPVKRLSCPFCPGSFSSVERLKSHIKLQESRNRENDKHKLVQFLTKMSEEMPIQCSRCKFVFSFEEFHSENYDHAKFCATNRRKSSGTPELSDFRFKCPECPIIALNFSILDDHVRKLHEKEYSRFRTIHCQEVFKFSNKCEDCGFYFATKKELRLHEENCEATKSLKCPFCDQVEDDWQDLVTHVDMSHHQKYDEFRKRKTGFVKYQCDHCLWWFTDDFNICTNCGAEWTRVGPTKKDKRKVLTLFLIYIIYYIYNNL